LDETLALYDPVKHRYHSISYGQDPGLVSLSYEAMTLELLGYKDQALKKSREAIESANKTGHPYGVVLVHVFGAVFHHFRREKDEVLRRANEAIRISAEKGYVQWLAHGIILRAWASIEDGREKECIAQMLQGLDAWGKTGAMLALPYYLVPLAEAYGMSGQNKEGLKVLEEALDLARKNGDCYYEAEIHRLRGELVLSRGDEDRIRAEFCFREAMAIAGKQSAKCLELRAAMSLARLLRRQGKKSEAKPMLSEIYNWFTEGFETVELKDAKRLLYELE
jgi:predicted ATPase